jgi:hypothetical protein
VLAAGIGGRPVAFATVLALGSGTRFLEYLAVRSDARGGGHGGRLLDALLEDGGVLLLEVEDPAEPGLPPAEVRARERRIVFYAAHGAGPAPHGLSYRPPSFDGTPTPRMLLLACGPTEGWTLADVLQRLATAASITYATARSAPG